MRQHAKTPSAVAKMEIQRLLRQAGINRDGGCIFAGKPLCGEIHECSGWRNDGEIVLQYDHLNPRGKNVSYANLDLGVIICKGLHGWKKWNKEVYDKEVRELIGERRAKLWDRVKDDRKSYPMDIYSWNKEIMYLKSLLK